MKFCKLLIILLFTIELGFNQNIDKFKQLDKLGGNVLLLFLKSFAPGADRFADVDVVNNIASGGPVLSDSLAFLDCKVSSRLETQDHWIIYGTVENGSGSDLSCKTAVHHRKVANHY